jgi:N-formylglutamate amidohydrolase
MSLHLTQRGTVPSHDPSLTSSAGPLVAPTYRITAPVGVPVPLVVSVPHAGSAVPDEDLPLLALAGSQILRDADLFVDRLFAHAPSHGAPLITASVSRYVLDVNRNPDDVDADVCPLLAQPAKPCSRGLIWRQTTEGAPVLRRPLTPHEVQSRRARIHAPYHAALAALLEERRKAFGYAILLDAHSMPSLGRHGHTDPGARRADIVPGDVKGQSCDPRLMDLVSAHFASAGFIVRPNDPYMGGYVTRHHGRPAQNVHAIQLELNRDLYMDEMTLTWNAAAANALIPHLDALTAKLARLVL